MQQEVQKQAAAQAAQAAALQVHPLAAGGALVQNGRVIAERAKEETFHPPVTQIDPVTGMPQTVAFSNLGNRKVIDTAGAYTPDQWNSMSMADKAKMLFDQYKFGNLSAEQLVQAGQKNAQLGQELQKLQFETGKGGPGPVPIPKNAPMPNLLNPAPVGIPVVNPAATSAVNAQPVVAPGSQVAPVVNQALAPAVKKPYQALNAPSPIAAPAPVVAPTPVVTGEQPPAGLSPKAQQQWIVENSKKQIELAKDKPQAELSATTALTNLTRMKNVAEELSQHKGLNSIVGKWNQYSIFDTSDNAVNARALQGTLVKQSATAALQAMRDASKTGGAVGSVSEKEWPILEQQIAALDSAQTPKAYRTALENLKSQVDSSMTNIRKAYEIQHGKLEFTPPKYYRQDETQPSAWKVVQ